MINNIRSKQMEKKGKGHFYTHKKSSTWWSLFQCCNRPIKHKTRDVWSNRKSDWGCDSEQPTHPIPRCVHWQGNWLCVLLFFFVPLSDRKLFVFMLLIYVCPSQFRASLAKVCFCLNPDSTATVPPQSVSLNVTKPNWARNWLLLISDQRHF